MAFSLGFSSKKGKSKTSTSDQTDATRTQAETQTGSQAGTSEQQTSLLSEDIIGLLENIIGQQGGSLLENIFGGEDGKGTTEQVGDLSSILSSRAAGADDALSGLISPIVDEARRSGERELTGLETKFAREAGGSVGNSFVTAATSEGRASLESQLAGLEASLGLQARAQGSEEIQNALSAISSGAESSSVQNFAQLVNVLKGSKATATGKTTEESEQSRNLTDILTQLTTSASKTKTKSSGFSLGI